MLNKKIEEIKQKMQETSPRVRRVVLIGTTAALTLTAKYLFDEYKQRDEITLELTKDDLEIVKSGESDMTYYIDGHNYLFTTKTPGLTEE